MTKKEADLIVDDKPVKVIVREDKTGKKIDTMFRIKKGNSGLSPHIVHVKPEESHLDIFDNGEKMGENRTAKPHLAGVAFNLETHEFVPLPPIVLSRNEPFPQTPKEKALEYVKRVKIDTKK